MKKLIFFLTLLLSLTNLFSQENPIYGSKIIVRKRDTSSAEFQIINSTRNVSGFLKNTGGGNTIFKIPSQSEIAALPDSLLARYTKTQADARFKSISYIPDWLELTGVPSNFSTTYALSNDIQDSLLNKVTRSGSYADPSWITSINYSKLVGTIPTWNQNTTGNAATVTNGVYTTGSYANPAWITSLDYSKLTGTVPTWNQNTTGNAATVTNGVYTTGSYADPSWITSLGWSKISGAPAFITGINSSMVTTALGYTTENISNKGIANGYADLDAGGKIPASRIDFGQTGQTFVVASQAAMLAVSGANIGALAIRTDESKNYRLIAQPASTLANWQLLLSPDAPVQSVNGYTGNVNLLTTHISEGSNYWWTAARSRAAQSLTTTGSSGSATYDNSTGVLNVPTYTLAGLGGISLTSLSFTPGSGGYNSSTGVITIPTNTNQLTNGAGYLTSSALSPYALISGTTFTGTVFGTSFQGTELRAQKSQTDGSYTSAALWTESYANTTTGVAFHISGVVGKYLEMRTNGVLYWDGGIVLNSYNFNSYSPTLTGGGASGNWGINITGNAATVTNGVYTTGSYANPSWITSLDYSKLTGSIPTWNQNTTGNAATVTNGVYTTGSYANPSWITSLDYSKLTGTIPTWNQNTTGNAATATTTNNWGGNTLGGASSSAPNYLFGAYAGGNAYYSDQTAVRAFLALGSYAYRSSGLAELSGATFTGKLFMPSSGSDGYGGAIEIRERGYVGETQSDWSYSPALSFHWGNRFAKRLGFNQNGILAVDNQVIWGAYNDGDGSGLDADLVDGIHASEFLRFRGSNEFTDFQTYQSSVGVRFDQINNTATFSNAPGGYTFGGLVSFRGGNMGLQLWGSHTGNFYFKTQWDNDQFSGWREILHSTNFSAFSPTLTGGGASGNWGINITGNAATATNSTQWGGYTNNIGGGPYSGAPDQVAGFSGTTIQRYNSTAIQSFLGLGSYAYRSSGLAELSGSSFTGKSFMVSSGTETYGGAIEIRERGYVQDAQSGWDWSPAITFHWSNRAAGRFGLQSGGNLAWNDNPILTSSNATYAWNMNQNVRSSDNVSFNQVTSLFVKSGSSDSYLLLGGGGHVLASTYATASSLSGYVDISNNQYEIGGNKTFLADVVVNGKLTASRILGNTATYTSAATISSSITTAFCSNSSGSNYTLTMPSASGVTGQIMTVILTSGTLANTVTLSGINGGSYALTCYASVVLVSDGSTWKIASVYNNTAPCS